MKNTDRAIFIAAFVAAAAGIFILKYYFAEYAWASSAWAVIVLTALFIHTLVSDRGNERAGDNLYYLGLLFTLIILGYSLYTHDFAVAGGAQVFDVVTSFGVALSSTVFGILYRVIIQSFQPDLTIIETQARRELGKAMGHFRTELYQWSKDISAFLLVVRQLFAEVNEMLQENSRLAGDHINDAAARLEQTTDRLQSSFEKQEARVTETVTRTQEAMDQISSRLGAMVDGPGGITARLDETFAQLQGRINEVGDTLRTRMEQQLHASTKSLESFLQRLDTFSERLKVLESSPDIVVKEFRELAQTLKKSLSPVQEVVDTETRMINRMDEFVQMIQDVDVSRLSQSIDTVAAKTASLGERISGIGEDMAMASRQLSETLKTSESQVQGHVRVSEDFRQSMQSHLDASRVMVQEVHQSLLDAAQAIRKEIDSVGYRQ